MTWRERIQAAREQGHFTLDDHEDACGRLNHGAYALCAVGEQADRYGTDLIFQWPDTRRGVLDQLLRTLGGIFAGDVSMHDFSEAERVLDRIEDRALELKLAQ